jgi:hypothetical protein
MKIPFISRWLSDRKVQKRMAERRAEQAVDNDKAMAKYKEQMGEIPESAMFWAMTTKGPGAFNQMPRPEFSLKPYTPPFKDVVCPDSHVLAMDAILPPAYGQNGQASALFSFGGFPGYAFLTQLTQINEYRDISEATAKEMTRKWIKLRTTGDKDRDDIITGLEEEMTRLHVKDHFLWAATMDGFMGHSFLYLDFGNEDPDELKKPLMIDVAKVKQDSFKRIKPIEPITTYPAQYNADDPTAADYYEPSSWFIYSKEIHASRMLHFCSRPVPDLLKPVYCFGGMSLSQLAIPYVDYWLTTRDSVGRLLKNFSTTVFKTDMSGVLQGTNYENFRKRVQFYTQCQNNQGVFMCDKETEDFAKVETSLSGLDKLQAQAQEHMASVAKTPLTILFGLSPVGLTATAETDITIFNNHINTMQEAIFRKPLTNLLRIIQLSKFGKIYDDIVFDFVDLVSMNEKDKSAIRTANGTTDVGYINAGVVSPKEVRKRIAGDPESGYDGLDVNLPEGKMIDPTKVPPAPGKGGKPGGGVTPKPGQPGQPADAGEEDEDDPDEDEDAQAGAPPKKKVLQDAALMMLNDAKQYAMDKNLWFGNQHTGPIGLGDEDKTITAMKHSAVAQKATNVANRTGSRGLHEKAVAAHQRALDAHKKALLPAQGPAIVVHENYIDAHKAAIASHRAEASHI